MTFWLIFFRWIRFWPLSMQFDRKQFIFPKFLGNWLQRHTNTGHVSPNRIFQFSFTGKVTTHFEVIPLEAISVVPMFQRAPYGCRVCAYELYTRGWCAGYSHEESLHQDPKRTDGEWPPACFHAPPHQQLA